MNRPFFAKLTPILALVYWIAFKYRLESKIKHGENGMRCDRRWMMRRTTKKGWSCSTMKADFFHEPELEFGNGCRHIDVFLWADAFRSTGCRGRRAFFVFPRVTMCISFIRSVPLVTRLSNYGGRAAAVEQELAELRVDVLV